MIESSNSRSLNMQKPSYRVMVVEDEEELRELIGSFLTSEGYHVVLRADGGDLIWQLETHNPDIILLDQMLPGKQGQELLAEIRSHQRFSTIPVIMVTAVSREQEVVSSLGLGADDYLTKPFSFLELVARVGAVLRRTKGVNQKMPPDILHIGEIRVDLGRRSLQVGDGAEQLLTITEARILTYLLSHPGQVISREELGHHALEDEAAQIRTVDVHMAAIRKKLGSAKNCVQTIRSAGYCFHQR